MLIALGNDSVTVGLVWRLAGNSSGHLERDCAKQFSAYSYESAAI